MFKVQALSIYMSVFLCAAVLLIAVACSDDPCAFNRTVERTDMTPEIYDADVERASAIRHKYEDLFWRQPNVHGVGIGIIEDENGQYTDRAGFVIGVTEKVDQSTLRPEDRMPNCLEGVPVQIEERPEAQLG